MNFGDVAIGIGEGVNQSIKNSGELIQQKGQLQQQGQQQALFQGQMQNQQMDLQMKQIKMKQEQEHEAYMNAPMPMTELDDMKQKAPELHASVVKTLDAIGGINKNGPEPVYTRKALEQVYKIRSEKALFNAEDYESSYKAANYSLQDVQTKIKDLTGKIGEEKNEEKAAGLKKELEGLQKQENVIKESKQKIFTGIMAQKMKMDQAYKESTPESWKAFMDSGGDYKLLVPKEKEKPLNAQQAYIKGRTDSGVDPSQAASEWQKMQVEGRKEVKGAGKSGGGGGTGTKRVLSVEDPNSPTKWSHRLPDGTLVPGAPPPSSMGTVTKEEAKKVGAWKMMYPTADKVKIAVEKGKLSKKEAMEILQKVHGYE